MARSLCCKFATSCGTRAARLRSRDYIGTLPRGGGFRGREELSEREKGFSLLRRLLRPPPAQIVPQLSTLREYFGELVAADRKKRVESLRLVETDKRTCDAIFLGVQRV